MGIKLFAVLMLIAFSVPAASACEVAEGELEGFAGVRFGDRAGDSNWLLPAEGASSACCHEQLYRAIDGERRVMFGGVALEQPGVLYRFINDRFYAAEATFHGDGFAFEKLVQRLGECYGPPAMIESWRTAPRRSYVYRSRMQTAGWRSADGTRAVWLMSSTDGGLLKVIDNRVSADIASVTGGDRLASASGKPGAVVVE